MNNFQGGDHMSSDMRIFPVDFGVFSELKSNLLS